MRLSIRGSGPWRASPTSTSPGATPAAGGCRGEGADGHRGLPARGGCRAGRRLLPARRRPAGALGPGPLPGRPGLASRRGRNTVADRRAERSRAGADHACQPRERRRRPRHAGRRRGRPHGGAGRGCPGRRRRVARSAGPAGLLVRTAGRPAGAADLRPPRPPAPARIRPARRARRRAPGAAAGRRGRRAGRVPAPRRRSRPLPAVRHRSRQGAAEGVRLGHRLRPPGRVLGARGAAARRGRRRESRTGRAGPGQPVLRRAQ